MYEVYTYGIRIYPTKFRTAEITAIEMRERSDGKKIKLITTIQIKIAYGFLQRIHKTDN